MKKLFLPLVSIALLLSACAGQTQQAENEDAAVETKQIALIDYGHDPIVFDIEEATHRNENFRTAFWTGDYIQMTLMTLQPGEDIGLELHTTTDQFIRVEEGTGTVFMGDTEENLDFIREIKEDFAVFIPAGKWHNLKNIGDKPLKLYSIYAPAEHAHGTVHKTRTEGIEHDHDH